MKFIFFFTILSFLFCVKGFGQHPANFGFETISQTTSLPEYWQAIGPLYTTSLDSIHKVEGQYAVVVKSNPKGDSFGGIGNQFPNKYKGTSITLEGFIKTEKVEDGYAGLLIRLDDGQSLVAIDTMRGREVKGTTDWQKYTVSVPLKKATAIYVAGFFKGKGQVWFDNFKVLVDGEELPETEFVQSKFTDHEFDNGSRFSIKNATILEINQLSELCKTWGRLKYTNSAVGKGKYNWDYELFRALPMVKEKDFTQQLRQWKESFGEIQHIIPQGNFYVDFLAPADNPIFKNEKGYEQMNYADDGYRLLALFRYWNMIEYFFPYKHLIKKDWNIILEHYIPEILMADDELTYQLKLMELLAEVEDSHTGIYNPTQVALYDRGRKHPTFQISFVKDTAVVTKLVNPFPHPLNIKVGDQLIAINGKKIEDRIKEIEKYISASNYPNKLLTISYRLLATNLDKLALTLSNEDGEYETTVPTVPVQELNGLFMEQIPSHKELDNQIGYIYPESLQNGEIQEIMTSFMNKKGIVVDLRCYPADFIVYSMGNFLMPNPTNFVKFKNHNQKELEGFYMTEPSEVGIDFSGYYKGRIAILVNEKTLSNAEFTAMAFQVAPKAKVFGSQTAGADGNVSEIILPGGFKTYMTGIGIYYPDGTETQQAGIKIDEYITPTIQSIREGKDIVLEKALDYLKN